MRREFNFFLNAWSENITRRKVSKEVGSIILNIRKKQVKDYQVAKQEYIKQKKALLNDKRKEKISRA